MLLNECIFVAHCLGIRYSSSLSTASRMAFRLNELGKKNWNCPALDNASLTTKPLIEEGLHRSLMLAPTLLSSSTALWNWVLVLVSSPLAARTAVLQSITTAGGRCWPRMSVRKCVIHSAAHSTSRTPACILLSAFLRVRL